MESKPLETTLDQKMFSIQTLLTDINKSVKDVVSYLKDINKNKKRGFNINASLFNASNIGNFGGVGGSSKTSFSTIDIVSGINLTNSLLQQILETISFMDIGSNKNHIVNTSPITINFFDKSTKESTISRLEGMFKYFTELLKMPVQRFEQFSLWLKGFNHSLKEIASSAKSASFYLSIFSGVLMIFTVIGWGAIIKAGIAFQLLSFSIGLSLKFMVKSLREFKWKELALLMGGLPDLVASIARSAINLSIAAILFNFVEFSSIIKLSLSMVLIGKAIEYLSNIKSRIKLGMLFNSISIGLLLLVIPFYKFNDVNWSSIFKLTTFMVIFGITMKIWENIKPSLLTSIGFGIFMLAFSIFVMAEIDTITFIQIISLLAGLGWAIKKFMKDSKMDLGVGIETTGLGKTALGLIAISIAMLFITMVPWEGVFKMITFIGLLALSLKILGFNKSGIKPQTSTTGLFGFAFGLTLLLLVMDAFSEVNWSYVGIFLVFTITIALITRLFKGKSSGLLGFAFGMAILLLVLDAFSEISWTDTLYFLGFIGALTFILKFLNPKSYITLLALGVAIGVLAVTVKMIDYDAVLKLGSLAIGVLAIALVAFVIGLLSIPVIIGAGVLLVLSVSLLMFATTLLLIDVMNIDNNKISAFNSSIYDLVWTVAKMMIPAIPALIVAVMLIPISVSLLITAGLFFLISKLEIDNSKIVNFVSSIDTMLNSLTNIGILTIGEAVLKAVAMIPITISMFLAGITLGMISKLDVKPEKIHSFGRGLTLLIDRINDIGGWNLAKTALKSALLLPIIGVSFLSALALKGISALDIKPEKMLSFGDMLRNIIGTITEIVSEYKDILNDDKIIKGVEGISKIISTVGSVAGAVEALANMRFNEYEVRNGQLVLKSSRPINDSDIRRVAQNVGTLIEGLINPIKILGANFAADKIDFMGKKIDNPFVSSDFEKGVDALAKISGAFKPIVDSISKYFESPLMKEDGMVLKFTNSVWDIVKMFIGVFNTLGKQDFDIKLITNTTTKFSEFIDLFEKFKDDKLSKMEISINKFVNALSDDDKWRKINTNIKNLSNELWSISKAINNISIEKATKLNNILYNMSDKNNSQVLREILEALYGIIDKITTTENNENSNTVQPINNTTGGSSFTNPLKQAISGNKNIQENNDNLLSKILEILQNLDIPKPPTVQKVHVVSSDSRGVY